MSRRLLISAMPGETRIAWLAEDRLSDLVILRDDQLSVTDAIYLGRVTAIDRGLACAFVEIGLARPGLLRLMEAPEGLAEGDPLIVRIKRAPAADKGARLSLRGIPQTPEIAAAARAKPPVCLRAAADPVAAALAASRAPERILVDDAAIFARAKHLLAGRPEARERLFLDPDRTPLFEREGVEAAIEDLLQPWVALPSGGSLLIEPGQTLTAIDVNSGRHPTRPGAAAQGLAVNLEAVPEIARQLRLRHLSGLIVIDFLEPADPAAGRRVIQALKAALEADPQPCRVSSRGASGMSASGLVEMTRRRARPALHELLTEPCGIGGGGRVKDPVTLAYEALRSVQRQAATEPGHGLALCADTRVIAALRGPAAPALASLQARLGRPLVLRPEPEPDGPRGKDPGRGGYQIVVE